MLPLFSDVRGNNETELRFEVLGAMKIHTVVFWVMAPYSLVNGYSVSAEYTEEEEAWACTLIQRSPV